jgi:tetratricopeptide (TPR) repeat protein
MVIAAGQELDPDDNGLLDEQAQLLDASGRREEALAVWRTLKGRDPDDLSPYFMSAFALEALGRYQEAAAEWRYIIGWPQAHDMALHTTWPKEMLNGIQDKLSAQGAQGG